MPQPVLTKYKQGDLGKPYPKKRDKMKNLDLTTKVNPEVSTKDYPTKPNNHVQASFWKKASEKNY